MRLNRFNTQITIIRPKDNNDIIDILSKVFGFIDNKEEIKRKISRRLNNNLSIKIELNGKIVGCYLLAEKSINEFIRQINSNELKDFPKNETNIMISDKLSDNGIQGISLAILPEYRDKGFGEKLKNYVDNLDYDYIWGVQDKKLENINFWTKTRKIIVESDTHFATLKVRNNMRYIKLFEQHSRQSIVSFLLDFGMFITMNLSKIESESKDSDSKKELSNMLSELRKPLINGKSFSEITSDMDLVLSNPKVLSGLFSQIRDLLIYIEPRIQKFVIDSDKKNIWLDKIDNFKDRYRDIIKK